jgi:2-polyprenyl-3-methyl-5-hydroxy-6-metoxy-1,4-benzoquinol methylase
VTDPRDAEARWRQEAAFFDAKAAEHRQRLQPISPAIVERYRTRSRINGHWPKEHALGLLGDVRGLRILDVGSGEGQDAVLLATLGAQVTALELSSEAVALARAYAEASGVADRITWVQSPVETFDAGAGQFDVAWCAAFLHHVLADLSPVCASLKRALKPGGRFVAIEPLRTSGAVRLLRRLFPVPPDATPDERPLQHEDLAVIRGALGSLEVRRFYGLARLQAVLLTDKQFETASALVRGTLDVATGLDQVLLNTLGLESLAGVAVLHARV